MFGLGPIEIIILAGLALGALGLVLVLIVLSRKKGGVNPDRGLTEDLSEYPPAPRPGTHRLMFEGQPVRLRFVVLAPAGRSVTVSAEMAEGLLQAVMYGLGEVADLDRPRVRVWPAQLSQEGFAPKFFDNVLRPEPSGKPSRWVLLAGPAKAGTQTNLLGLALQSAEPTSRGNVRMNLEAWNDKLRVQVTG